jgi:hypothetical protein
MESDSERKTERDSEQGSEQDANPNPTNTITLAADKPKIFGVFLAWISTRDFDTAKDYIEANSSKLQVRRKQREDQLEQLEKCYFLANSLQAFDFADVVVDRFVGVFEALYRDHRITGGYSAKNIALVWQNTASSTSPLRRLIMDAIMEGGDVDHMPTHGLSLPHFQDFWIDLARRVVRKSGHPVVPREPWEISRCRYHVHPGERPGYSCVSESGTWSDGVNTA